MSSTSTFSFGETGKQEEQIIFDKFVHILRSCYCMSRKEQCKKLSERLSNPQSPFCRCFVAKVIPTIVPADESIADDYVTCDIKGDVHGQACDDNQYNIVNHMLPSIKIENSFESKIELVSKIGTIRLRINDLKMEMESLESQLYSEKQKNQHFSIQHSI